VGSHHADQQRESLVIGHLSFDLARPDVGVSLVRYRDI
jgi:hypothetical protein